MTNEKLQFIKEEQRIVVEGERKFRKKKLFVMKLYKF